MNRTSQPAFSRRQFNQLAVGSTVGAIIHPHRADAEEKSAKSLKADVCVYGGTASGVMAAVAAAREGWQVTLIEPSRWLGGMTGGGLDAIDWGREQAVGGSTRGILKQDLDDVRFRELFAKLVEHHKIRVVYEHRLGQVHRQGKSIVRIDLDHAPPDAQGCPVPEAKVRGALSISAKIFIDCSYEGDLMASAGVSYTWGRESTKQYGESLAGVRPDLWTYDIDPYRKPGDPQSGLLPLLQDTKVRPLRSADRLTMGYCFRYKFSQRETGLPIEPPDNYDPADYEVYRRGFKQGINLLMNRKMKQLDQITELQGSLFQMRTGNLSRSLLTTTVYGCNADYPDGDWKERSRIWKFHQHHLRGLKHFLQTEPSAPEKWKQIAGRLRLRRGPFDQTEGWPHQLYVREARRMVSDYVVTQEDLAGKTSPNDSVGLASYGIDDWPYATYPVNGKVALSGGAFSQLYLDTVHAGIYRIPYRSMTPREQECHNLLVPVCVSASHIAMTSIRMEPVWMILGESAGMAASLALRDRIAVQAIDYDQLRRKLLNLGQRLDPVKG